MHATLQRVRDLWVEAGAESFDGTEEKQPCVSYRLVELPDDIGQLEFDWGSPIRLVTNQGSYQIKGRVQMYKLETPRRFEQLLGEYFEVQVYRPFRRAHVDSLNESGPALRIRLKQKS